MNPLTFQAPLWAYLCVVAFALTAAFSASWIKDHYEICLGRPVRRWYGSGAWVTIRDEGDARWLVLGWSSEATPVPALLVSPVDEEDADAFWGAVTDFGPYAVRRFRPYLWHGWLPVLFARVTYDGSTP